MITVRQIDRLWSAKAYDRLLEQLISPRPEASDRLLSQLPGSLPAAAMAIIRLDEMSQSYVSMYGQLVRIIIAAQTPAPVAANAAANVAAVAPAQNSGAGSTPQAANAFGGWGDVLTTALCLRALLCGNGHGQAIDRGIAALAGLQKPEGIWPAEPVRRMPVDAFASAFVLLQLGSCEAFRNAVRLDDAVDWFEDNQLALDAPTAKLWAHAKLRLPVRGKRNSLLPAASGTDSAGIGSLWSGRLSELAIVK